MPVRHVCTGWAWFDSAVDRKPALGAGCFAGPGDVTFQARVGLWVLHDGARGVPVQHCPWCGERLVPPRGWRPARGGAA